jgi:hypothetical protein
MHFFEAGVEGHNRPISRRLPVAARRLLSRHASPQEEQVALTSESSGFLEHSEGAVLCHD